MARFKIDLVSASTDNKRKHSVYLTIGFIFSEILWKKKSHSFNFDTEIRTIFRRETRRTKQDQNKKKCERMKNWCKSVFRASELKYLSMELCETRDFF